MEKLGTSRKMVFLFGALTAVLPFLGFPGTWKTWMYVLLGLLTVFFTALSAVPSHLLRWYVHAEKHTLSPEDTSDDTLTTDTVYESGTKPRA